MTLHDLMQTLTTADLYPILVEGDIDRDSVRGLSFVGNLDGFIQAAKALGARCVFVMCKTLEEVDFFFQAEDANGGRPLFTDTEEPDPQSNVETSVDLRAVELSLNEFKDRLGSECGYRLAVYSPTVRLEYILHLEWWNRFSELRIDGIEKVLQKRYSAEAQRREEEEIQRQKIVDTLRELIHDPDFVRLPTQLAMREYAFEKVANLDTVDPKSITTEIQSLVAKMKARGLGRKKYLAKS
jgi:hypothetical protein